MARSTKQPQNRQAPRRENQYEHRAVMVPGVEFLRGFYEGDPVTLANVLTLASIWVGPITRRRGGQVHIAVKAPMRGEDCHGAKRTPIGEAKPQSPTEEG